MKESRMIDAGDKMRAACYELTKSIIYHLKVDSGREDISEDEIRNGVANGLSGALDVLGYWDMEPRK